MERRELHVLLVEDDEDDSLLTRGLLAEIPDVDLDCDWAPSYVEGLERVAAGSVDVCLVDHFLGARTGVDFVREARALPAPPPLILLTGASSREIDLAAMEAGASDFLQKEGVTAALLDRSIRYSIQKQKAAVAELALVRERAARGAAESANRAKDQILARLSHELRTPLAPILGVATLLEDEPGLSDAGRGHLRMLRRNAEQEARLIDDLLDLTQGLEQRREVRKEVADLASLLEIAIGSGEGAVQVEAAARTGASGPQPGRPLYVLLVEDHEDTALATAALLRRLGHRVTRAADSPAALAAIVEASPRTGPSTWW